jgi:predicted RNase H-like HicB family nuclease
MLTEYVRKAMGEAVYEKLEDGTYSGEIPECPGTIAFGQTLQECQAKLESALEGWVLVKIRHGDDLPEGWVLVKIRHGDDLPVIAGIDLNKMMPKVERIAASG